MSHTMTSLWLDRPEPGPFDGFEPDAYYDAVVVGAGLTGLSTAVLLARAGLHVAVLEARRVGAVTTGHTTAKLSLLQHTVLSGISRHFSDKTVRAYVDGNREGQAWLLRYLEEHGVPFQRRDAYTYATTEQGRRSLEKELKASLAAGLDVQLIDDTGLPYPTTGALLLRDQAQFDPLDVLTALAEDLRERGGRIVEGARVLEVKTGTPTRISTSEGDVQAGQVVLASGTPILDRGLYFAKLEPGRSYALAFEVPVAAGLPRGMYLSVDQPSRSLRTVPRGDTELLLVGGNGHVVGREDSPARLVADLEEWAGRHFPGARRTHAWSAQDYRSANMVPFVGALPRGGGKIHLATGYNKWGMTNAVAAALSLSAEILGGHVEWAQTLHHRVTSPADVVDGVKINAGVAGHLAADWVRKGLGVGRKDGDDGGAGAGAGTDAGTDGGAAPTAAPDTSTPMAAPDGTVRTGGEPAGGAAGAGAPADGEPAEGQGLVKPGGLHPVAVSRTDGRLCAVSAVCTHLGGILSWNDAERSWDCPLHGSRFSATGERLEGPAVHDLKRMDY